MTSVPLVVDFEHGLLSCDLGVEATFALAKVKPLHALGTVLRFASGSGTAVAFVERHQHIDVAGLPYNAQVVALVQSARKSGQPVYLASSRYREYATAAAEHLNLFDAVLTPDALDGLAEFDLIADARSRLGARARRRTSVLRSKYHPLMDWLRALRLHQWLKNTLVLVPLLASHRLLDPSLLLDGLIAFVLFGCCASSVYLLNDLFDLRDDRHHPTKRNRPFASGRLPLAAGLVVLLALLVFSFAGSLLLLPREFTASLGVYYAVTLAYSLALKRVMMLDVVVLAGLYTLRIVAGTFVFGGELTFWMLAFSVFMFASLALAKRYGELREARLRSDVDNPRGRGYLTSDLEMISAMGIASGLLAVMVLAFYIQDQGTTVLYSHPKMIWFACPVLLYWVGRTWMLTHRGQMHDDPVVFAITDRVSLLTGLVFGLIFVLAS